MLDPAINLEDPSRGVIAVVRGATLAEANQRAQEFAAGPDALHHLRELVAAWEAGRQPARRQWQAAAELVAKLRETTP